MHCRHRRRRGCGWVGVAVAVWREARKGPVPTGTIGAGGAPTITARNRTRLDESEGITLCVVALEFRIFSFACLFHHEFAESRVRRGRSSGKHANQSEYTNEQQCLPIDAVAHAWLR